MLPEVDIQCPYCGETITLLVDASGGNASYIEDCQVCCQPIRIDVNTDGLGAIADVTVRSEDA